MHPVERREPDEVILGSREVAYILQVPGYEQGDFLVSVDGDSLEIKTKDFVRRKELGAIVKPETVAVTYRNGILSVRMKRGDT